MSVVGVKRGRYTRRIKEVKSKTGYRGVSQRGNRFQAALSIKNTHNKTVFFHIGTFDTAELAHKARIKFINKLK